MLPDHPDYLKEPGLPPGWELRWSSSKQRAYFFRERGSEWDSTWEPPAGTDVPRLDAYLKQLVAASHLLVKHSSSRNAKSWREATITRPKEEAKEILEHHRATIVENNNQDTLPALATTESDCSSASKSGYLGEFKFGQMQMPFWFAAVKLNTGQVSDIVETASGLHLIQRMPPVVKDVPQTESALPS